METALQLLQPYYPQLRSQSPPPTTKLRRRKDVHDGRDQSSMRLIRNPSLLRITSTAYRFGLTFNRHHQLRPHPNNIISVYHKTMAEKSKDEDSQIGSLDSPATTEFSRSGEEKEEGGSKKKSTPAVIPPAPEKPLPGDCCGSGCVRCVWDVYYEELEEYNRLYKSDPTNPS